MWTSAIAVFFTTFLTIIGLSFLIYKFVKVRKARKEYEDGVKALDKLIEFRANHPSPVVIPQIQPLVKPRVVKPLANPVLSKSTAKRLEVQRKTVTPARKAVAASEAPVNTGGSDGLAGLAVGLAVASALSSNDAHSSIGGGDSFSGGGGGFDGGGASGGFDD